MVKKKNFEQSMNALTNIANEMQEDISLEASLKLYKDGVLEAKYCTEFLNNVEDEIYILKRDLDENIKLLKLDN